MKWMGGSPKRQCDRALPKPRAEFQPKAQEHQLASEPAGNLAVKGPEVQEPELEQSTSERAQPAPLLRQAFLGTCQH
jgi:hypothetical protein